MVGKDVRMPGVIEANHLHSKPNALNPWYGNDQRMYSLIAETTTLKIVCLFWEIFPSITEIAYFNFSKKFSLNWIISVTKNQE